MHGFMFRVIFDPNNFGPVIDACIQGKKSAQHELFKKYFGYGKSICQHYTSCSQDAEGSSMKVSGRFSEIWINMTTHNLLGRSLGKS